MPTCPALIRRLANAFLALALLTSWCSLVLAQHPPCVVPVTVQKFDLSTFPKEYIDRAVAWRKESRGHRPVRPGVLDTGEWGYATTDVWESALDVPTDVFVARDGKRAVPIRSVSIDQDPRRIVFVAENGRQTTAAARKIEAEVIERILSKARAEDSFALLTARGPRVMLPLGSSVKTVKAAVEKLGTHSQVESNAQGVLDALLEASTWLQPPRPGDSIFLTAMRVEDGNKVSVRDVRNSLKAGGIRLFGFQLGATALPGVGDVPRESPALSIVSGKSTDGMFALGTRTGGDIGFENTESERYQLKDDRLQTLKGISEQMYAAITQYYVLHVDYISSHIRIGLSRDSLKGLILPMSVLYPRDLPPCSALAAAKPVANGSGQ
jgi:hypothetical protein